MFTSSVIPPTSFFLFPLFLSFTLSPFLSPPPSSLLSHIVDCPKSHRQITPEEVEVFVKDNGFIRHFETSVKDGTNINETLE